MITPLTWPASEFHLTWSPTLNRAEPDLPVFFARISGTPRSGNRLVDDLLRFVKNGLQVLGIPEAFGINLVDVLGAGRARRKPSMLGDDLDAADRCAIAGCLVQHLQHPAPGQRVELDLVGGKPGQFLFLLV